LARIDLPLSTYTQWYWKIDLHNLLHFLTLRVDSHAQWEIRQFGKVMAGMLKRVAPLAYEAWIDYDVCGVRLSRMELSVLRWLALSNENGLHARDQRSFVRRSMDAAGMSKSEISELLAHFEGEVSLRPSPDFDLDLTQAKDAAYFEAQAAAAVPSGKR
jgi:thymidylate synthase (FAD)